MSASGASGAGGTAAGTTGVEVGIVLLPQERWAVDRHRWARAEELGFAHAWTYDHLAWRSLADEPWFATVPLLAAAAQVTSRIRLGTWVASPNFRHPVPFAKDVMGLDDVSEGRLLLGVGAGGTGFDAEVLGPPVSQRVRTERFEEFVALLDRLLTAPVTDHEGVHFTARAARMLPGCVQRPRVPFVVAANGPRAMRVAARYGQGWATYGPVLPDDDVGGHVAGVERWWAGLTEMVDRFEATAAEVGGGSQEVRRYLNLDSAPVYSLSSVDVLEEGVERARALGFTDVVVHWPRPEGIFAGREDVLEEVAGRLARWRR